MTRRPEADQRGKSSPLYTITPAQAQRFHMWLTHVRRSLGTIRFWKMTLEHRRYVPTAKHTHTLCSGRHEAKSSLCSRPWLWRERERSALAPKQSDTDFYQSVRSQRAWIKDAGKRLFVWGKKRTSSWVSALPTELNGFINPYVSTSQFVVWIQRQWRISSRIYQNKKEVKDECCFIQ